MLSPRCLLLLLYHYCCRLLFLLLSISLRPPPNPHHDGGIEQRSAWRDASNEVPRQHVDTSRTLPKDHAPHPNRSSSSQQDYTYRLGRLYPMRAQKMQQHHDSNVENQTHPTAVHFQEWTRLCHHDLQSFWMQHHPY